MKHLFLFLFSLVALVTSAQQVEPQKLWPDDPNAAEAEIFVYHPARKASPAPAILICPGGGYAGLAIHHEGHDMARWYASNGFVAVVLKYRMPKGVHTIPLSDAEQAMSVIRSNASQWNVDPNRVGVVGSSAGGHLAASLSTLAADVNRPNFAILYYPVISFDNMVTHGGSKQNLLGKDIGNQELIDRYSLQTVTTTSRYRLPTPSSITPPSTSITSLLRSTCSPMADTAGASNMISLTTKR